MRFSCQLVSHLFTLCLASCYALPVMNNHGGAAQLIKTVYHTTTELITSLVHHDPLENRGIHLGNGDRLIEGDIRQRAHTRYTQAQPVAAGYGESDPPTINEDHSPNNFRFRISVPIPEMTWTDRIVPYVIDEGFNTTEQTQIHLAITEMMEETGHCITFTPRTYQNDFIFITGRLRGCWSEVGRQGDNQTLSVSSSDNCVTKGIVMHELMHALGFWHEHNRSDRDRYVSVLNNNIILGHQSDFNKNEEGNLLNLTYDFYSIMHYKTNQFSKDPQSLRTIQILDPNIIESEVGQRKYLSVKDKQRIKHLYNCPRENCNYPTELNDGTVVVRNTSVGSRISYSCASPNFILVGASERTCMYNGKWSGSTPLCFSIHTAPVYCSFEDIKLCGWSQDTTDEADWTRARSHTPSEYTGPTVDHTLQNPEGYYMYIEGSGLSPNYKARLLSPVFPGQSNMCVLFWYNMYGSGMGNLTVYVKTDDGYLHDIWRKAGNQSQGWKMDLIAGLNPTVPYQIVFEASRGPRDTTDMAIDDVMIGDCDEITSYENAVIHENKTDRHACNFDTDMCGWQQDSSDNFDWTKNSGRTPSLYTGPNCDHTNCKNGSYMYIETSTGVFGDVARLVSPTFVSHGHACLAFSYHMYGTHTGNLSTIISTQQRSAPVWSASRNHGNRWFTEYIQLQLKDEFQVVIEATRGNGFRGDIAVDDLMLFPGNCPAVMMCTFESGFCDLKNEKLVDNFDWLLGQYTRTPTTGPSADHTFGYGTFAYIEASHPRKPGQIANLLTPYFYASQRGYCITLWYFMYGADVATLKMSLRRYGGMEKKLWYMSGDRGRKWHRVNIRLPAYSFKFQLVIQAKVGATYNSDIAIDDFSVREGDCQ